jgi:hypothetical protein
MSDTEPRPAGCLCTWEFGDSPCPVHPTCPGCGCAECECAASITILPEQLERFARELGLTQAILVGWSPDGTTHVVTWGASLTDSAQAAQGGNAVKRAIGFPETLCRALSRRVAEALGRAEAAGVDAAPEEWVCILCEQRNVTRSDSDGCCVSCGMDLCERGELLRFLVPDADRCSSVAPAESAK